MSIEKAVYEKKFDLHVNDQRTIAGFLKPHSESSIRIEQVRAAKVHKESKLGNHWREYGEIYGVLGNAKFILEDIKTKKRKEYSLKTGDTLYIPREVAIRIIANTGTVIICCSEKHEREEGTHKYNFE